MNVPLDEALQNLQQTIEENGVTIFRETLPTVPVDHVKIVQVFQNLIGNAIRFRKPDEPSRIEVISTPVQDGSEITVRDNGVGFDPKYSDRIFVMFQRVHGGDDLPGTGIGLAICKRIIEAHRGRIWAESQPGAGATFRFILPSNGSRASAG